MRNRMVVHAGNCNQLVFFTLVACLLLGTSIRAEAQAPTKHPSKPKAQNQAQKPDLTQPPVIPGMPFVHIVPYGTPTKLLRPPLSSAGGLFSYWGGPVISNIHIVEVLWGSHVDAPSTTGLQQFLTDIPNTNYFDLLSEYGTVGVTGQGGAPGSNQLIGRGFFDGKFTITPSICGGSASNPPPSCTITDTQIQAELQRQLVHLPAPVKDPQNNYDTIYLLYFPPGVHITVGTAPSCADRGFCAYHASLSGSLPSEIPYGVFPDFGPNSGCSTGCGTGSSADNLSSATSHEIGEAVTDENIGNATQLAPPLGWFSNSSDEIGDICNHDEQKITIGANTYTVQSLWSNVQGNCVIAPAQLILAGPTGAIPGKAINMTVTVSGAFGTVTQYSNTVHFTSSDAQSVLPADYTFDPNTDQGVHTFTITLNSLNSQTLTVTDTLAAPITGTATLNVNHNPDLTIAKTHTGNFTQGQTGAHYTLTVSNQGDRPTTGIVTVTDGLPPDLTATAMTGTGWTCTVATVTCTRADALAVNATYPAITLTVTVSATAQASITNSATVSGGGEANSFNDQANDPTTITQLPDPLIAVGDGGNFSQGAIGVAYTIVVTNTGNAPTTGTISVTDTLPAGLTATAISGQGWTCVLATRHCSRSDALPSFGSYPSIQLTVNVALNAPATIVDTATVSGGGEVNTANDTATDPTNVVGPTPDFVVSIALPATMTQGQTGVTYTLTTSNIGAAASSGFVSLGDQPGQLIVTAISGPGWTCGISPDSCSRNDVLAAGPNSSYPPVTVTANVPISSPASFQVTGLVSGGNEINFANDSDPAIATVIQVPDLTVYCSHSPFEQGQTGATYTLTASDLGGAATKGTVTLIDTLPVGLTATGLTGAGWNCTLATLTCTTNTVFINAYNQITLTVNVDPTAPATVTNTVTVSGGGETFTADDTVTDPTQILPPVSFTTDFANGQVTAGQSANYGLTVFSFASDPIVLSCTGLPALTACGFSPPSVTGQGSTMLTITTTAPTRSAANFGKRSGVTALYAILVPFLGIFLIQRKAPRKAKRKLVSSVTFLALLLMAGCGGGGSSSPPPTLHGGTPPGNYTITVTGTDSTASLQGSTTVTLIVNWNGL